MTDASEKIEELQEKYQEGVDALEHAVHNTLKQKNNKINFPCWIHLRPKKPL